MLKKYKVIQSDRKNCAASSLLSIIKYFGSDVSLDELTFIMKTDNNGTNAYNLLNAARLFGFDGYGMKCSFDELLSLDNYPVIVHVLKNNMYHFVVIYDINKKILIMDPEEGYVKISKEDFNKVFLGTILVIYPVKKIEKMNKNTFNSYILSGLFSIKYKIIKLFLITLFVIILSLANYVLLKYIIDYVTKYKSIDVMFIIVFILVILFKCLFDYVRMNKLIYVNNFISNNLNSRFFRHLFNLPYLFFKNKTTGEVVNRASDIDKFRDLISLVVNSLTDVLFMIFSIILLLYINYNLFLVILLFMIIFVFISLIFYKISRSRVIKVQMLDDDYKKNISESILSYEINKNLNLLDIICKKNELSFSKYIRSSSKYDKLLVKELLIKDVLISLCQIIIIIVGIFYVRNGYMTLGDYIIFNSLTVYFIDPIRNIMSLLPSISYAKEIVNRINNLIMFKCENNSEACKSIKGDISVKSLSYSYNGKDVLFENINLFIRYGSHVMIYAPSGSGKSTLLKIILKYLTDYCGEVYINNKNIKDIDNSTISFSFTYVSQNNYLINDTLKNNIIYYRDISEEDYDKVIKICHIDKIVNRSTLRDNFMIEENGFNLSGGERQKVIVARSLLKKSNYILLDEAFSEVSPEEEKMIIKNIRESFKDKCIIYVSHKPELSECFDEIIYFRKESL